MPAREETETQQQEPLLSHEPQTSQEQSVVKPKRPQISLFRGQIILNPTITKINFVCFLLNAMIGGGIMVPTGQLSLPLLTNFYGLNNDERLNVIAINQAIALVLKFITAPWTGYLSDKYGRRIFIIVGSAMQYLGVALTPNLPSVYPYYYLLSILTDLGMSFLMSAPLLADYIDYETKGRAAGIVAIIGYISSYLATTFTSSLNLEIDIPSRYHYIALTGCVLAIIIIPGLKGGAYHKQLYIDQKAIAAKKKAAEDIQRENLEQLEAEENQEATNPKRSMEGLNPSQSMGSEGPIISRDPEVAIPEHVDRAIVARRRTAAAVQSLIQEEPEEDLKPGLRAGIREAQRNPWILLGFITQFMGISFIMLLGSLFINYITIMVGNEQAATQAYNLSGKHLLSALVSCFVYGFLTDKVNKFWIINMVVILSAVSIVLIIFMPSPYSAMAYIAMVIFGIASSGYMTFNTQVISKYPNPKYRASVGAVSSMFATLGTAMINILGTLLSKRNPLIPFYLYLGVCAVGYVAIWVLYYYKRQILNRI